MKMTNKTAIGILEDIKHHYQLQASGFQTALSMGIAAIEDSNKKWIPVTEKLPNYEEEVLCQLSNGMAVLYLQDDWGQDVWVDGQMGTGTYKVIAWRPLPTEYKEK